MPRKAHNVTATVTQYQSASCAAPLRRLRLPALRFVASGKYGAGDIGNCGSRKLLPQSLHRRRRGLAQNRKDMGPYRTGCARRRPVLGKKVAAPQRSKDIAQSDVAGRPRQSEAASRAKPSADQSMSGHQREEAPNHDWVGVGAIRHILRAQDLAWIGGQRGQQVNANSELRAGSHAQFFAQGLPGLQSRRLPVGRILGLNDDRSGPTCPSRLSAKEPA
jgi:hypothetical protein